ncbi:MAG: hypothetical protein HZA08_04860 [Nitrospirae bacterium]|nr:hypothetical protein [Nitrospirota bacterium]
MIYLGEYKAGTTVFYAANFHNDTGTLEDPTTPEAQIRNSAGTWSALTAPAKQNTKTGHYGGTVDTTGFSVGQHVIRLAGTVSTSKTVATEFCFTIVANIESDTYARVGAPAGASVSADIAGIQADTNDLQTQVGTAGDGLTSLGDTRIANLDATVSSRASGTDYTATRAAKIDNLDATVSSRLASASYTAPDNAGISTILTESQSHPTLAEIEATTVLAKEATVSVVKAKTDNLPADPASNTQVNTRLATSGYTSPDNASITAIKAKTDTIAWQDVTDIKDAGLGKWSINKYTNILTMYKADGVTILKQFNLTDNASLSERVPV